MRHIFLGFGLLLAACAGPEFPETGQPSPYDGDWVGSMPSNSAECDGLTLAAEVRRGFLIGDVKKDGVVRAQVRGEISPNGDWEGAIESGAAVGSFEGQFSDGSATGEWSSQRCQGTLDLQKVAAS